MNEFLSQIALITNHTNPMFETYIERYTYCRKEELPEKLSEIIKRIYP